MERRFAVRYEELMAEAEVKPEALEDVLKRLGEFVKPFAASLKHEAQQQHAAEYIAGWVPTLNARTSKRSPTFTSKIDSQCRNSLAKSPGRRNP